MKKKEVIRFWCKKWDELDDVEIKKFCQIMNIRYVINDNKYVVKKMYDIERKKHIK